MRFRILTALSLSGLLILGAGFLRFRSESSTPPVLVAIDIAPSSGSAVSYAAASSTDLLPAKQEDLSTTDLVSRQMLSDYMNLAATGQTTEENINALAARYVESLPTLTQAKVINATDIKIVPDSLSAFKAYGNALADLTNETMATAAKIDSGSAVSLAGTDISGISLKLAAAYEHASKALLGMAVPSSILDDHVKLTNMYLSNTAALKALAQVDKDPTIAFAGMAKYNENLKAEDPLIADMRNILKAHGL
ncbi:hypothetical protein KW800_01020 [Candidatus Parcubacteria bacterium]|nr:hypothetical protein [Candidatus Parcubacteria bacterium]